MGAILSSILMGWALGSNHAANIFGPAVTANIFKFTTAAIITTIFLMLGAVLCGYAGMETIGRLTNQTVMQGLLCMLSAGLVVTFMTILRLPVSTAQAVIGAVIGAGIFNSNVHLQSLSKVVTCWICTPIVAGFLSYLLYISSARVLRKLKPNIFEMDAIIRWGLIFCCIYGAFALGANTVANTTGVFVKAGLISPLRGAVIGSASICLGVLTFSKNVIRTVGRKLVPLDGYSALVSLMASSMTIHFFAVVGVPISTSQSLIGAILGVGLVKGIYMINLKTFLKVIAGWVATPALAILVVMVLIKLFSTQF